MAQPQQEMVIKRYLILRFYDTRNKREIPHERLRILAEKNSNIVFVDDIMNEYVARLVLNQVFAKEATAEREPSAPVHRSSRPMGIEIRRCLGWRLHDPQGRTITQKSVLRLINSGQHVVVLDATANKYIARMILDQMILRNRPKWKPNDIRCRAPVREVLDSMLLTPLRTRMLRAGKSTRSPAVEAHRPNVLKKWQLIQAYLSRRQRLAWAGAEASTLDASGDVLLAQVTGFKSDTINYWKHRVNETRHATVGSLAVYRRGHGNRGQTADERDPELIPALERMLADDTAGDPMGHQKWTRCNPHSLSVRLTEQGHRVASRAVKRLLSKMGYAARPIKKDGGLAEASRK